MTIELPLWLAILGAIIVYGLVGGAVRGFLLWTKPGDIPDDEGQTIVFWFAILWPLGVPLFLLFMLLGFIRKMFGHAF